MNRIARSRRGRCYWNLVALYRRTRRAVGVVLATGVVAGVAGCATPDGGTAGFEDAGSDGNFWSLARKAEESGDYATAATFYRKAADTDGDSVKASVALGRTLYRAGKHAQAERAYRRAIQQAPETTAAHFGLGKTLVALDRPQAAIDAFDAGQQFAGSETVTGYIGKGVALDMLGRHGHAQRVYQAGLERAPDNIKLLNNYGLSLVLSGDLKTAIEVLEPLVRDGSGRERIRQNLALAYGLQGDLQQAAEIANYDLSPDAVDANLTYYRIAQQLVRSSGSVGGTSDGANKRGEAAASGRFWAQLGAYRSPDRARASWNQLQEAHPDLLGNRSLHLQAAEVDDKGTFHRLRVGPFSTSATPQELCDALKERDHGCVVTRNVPMS